MSEQDIDWRHPYNAGHGGSGSSWGCPGGNRWFSWVENQSPGGDIKI